MPTTLRESPWLTLWFPLALFGVAVAISVGAVVGPVRDVAFEQRSRATLLAIQRAVQDYHVAEEFYPKRSPQTGAELIAFLIETGHLAAPPLNPWTGSPYRPGEASEPDGILYRTDELAETYAMECRGRDLANPDPLWQLDSTTHQSLE